MTKLDQSRAPLAEALEKQIRTQNISFHMPGHKERADGIQGAGSVLGQAVLSSDYTEIDGLDDLHAPRSVIREAEMLAAECFHAQGTFFLVNGTTSGIAAAIGAVCNEDSLILVERACHSSVTTGLILSGATPYYIEETYDEKNGVISGISTESVRRAFENCTDAKAIILSHPNYYGTYSDLEAITAIAHQHGAVVIADEAHGAQMQFTGQVPAAMQVGADICIQSTHKMIGSMTQSSMLHWQGDRVDPHRLRYFISMMNSTSPSYPLMASLDLARRQMALQGKTIWQQVRELTKAAGEMIDQIPGIHWVREFVDGNGMTREVEGCRLVISGADLGLSGTELSDILRNEHGIDMEFADSVHVIALAGAGSTKADFDRLTDALRQISEAHTNVDAQGVGIWSGYTRAFRIRPQVEITPRTAVMAPLELLEPGSAAGGISARDVSVYPPGIPILRPGETITEEIVQYIEEALEAGLEFHGLVEEGGEIRLAVSQDMQRTMLFNCFF